eukprot:2642336-Prymnesium_polylepis.1
MGWDVLWGKGGRQETGRLALVGLLAVPRVELARVGCKSRMGTAGVCAGRVQRAHDGDLAFARVVGEVFWFASLMSHSYVNIVSRYVDTVADACRRSR